MRARPFRRRPTCTSCKPGDAVPDTKLIDQDGTPIALTDFKGSALAVTFIYTRCPLPQFCPLIDRRFAEVQKMAAADPALAGKVRLLSVSFDPEFDRAEVLRAHAAKLGADPAVWRFATADEAIVDRLAAAVRRQRDSREGRHHHPQPAHRGRSIRPAASPSILDNNAWTADELVAGLTDALAAAR